MEGLQLHDSEIIKEVCTILRYGIIPIKAHTTNIRYHVVDADKLLCDINDMVVPRITIKHFNAIE